ncbi:dihydrofolate reductase family protein [Actinoplanes missouriensis]|uniref:dihydrofolate reductase family protein n=1 Tax=Actinoplanes missouriensis TaxID=1866 RepID=UPI0033E73828
MGTISIDLFTTLDLVAQAPGGPEEDPEGFPFGGWQAPLIDEIDGEQVWAGMQGMDALLLGRRTYDIFAAHWPRQTGDIAGLFNRIPKYVASHGDPDLSWEGSTRVGVGDIRALRDKHEKIHVIGSLNLVQTLLRERLFDRLNLWIHPIVLGVGKKVFDGGAVPASLSLAEPPVTSSRGTVLLRYRLEPGTPATGDMTVTAEPTRS